MSKKQTNSVLFIATLGVYIGLLMAGAAPAVVAQQAAAMTRNFELSDEIEKKDDLDKDPSGYYGLSKDIETLSSTSFTDAFLELVSDLNKLESADLVKRPFRSPFSFDRGITDSYVDSESQTIYTSTDLGNPWIQTAFEKFFSRINEKKLNHISDWTLNADGDEVRRSNGHIFLSEDAIVVSLEFTKATSGIAFLASKHFEEVFQKAKADSSGYGKLISESTKVSAENDQVTIVTRLPRAALDELLAKDAK